MQGGKKETQEKELIKENSLLDIWYKAQLNLVLFKRPTGPIRKLDSESNFVIGRPATNSRRKF